MAVAASRVTVDDTAGGTALITGGTHAIVTNRDGSESISLGASGVTFADGYELKAGETVELVLPTGDELYDIADATISVVAHVLRTGV